MNKDTFKSRRGWEPEEDQILIQTVKSYEFDKIKWVQVAILLSNSTGKSRTGKQCRQRWQHQLDPTINRQILTRQEHILLFELQIKIGNKWSQISAQIPGRTDNILKNYFYSTVRKLFTKINLHLNKSKSKKIFTNIRQFESDFLSKLMAVMDNNDKKVKLIESQTSSLAKEILKKFSYLTLDDSSFEQVEQEQINSLIVDMHSFRKGCKKRKTRKSQTTKVLTNSIYNNQSNSIEEQPLDQKHEDLTNKNEKYMLQTSGSLLFNSTSIERTFNQETKPETIQNEEELRQFGELFLPNIKCRSFHFDDMNKFELEYGIELSQVEFRNIIDPFAAEDILASSSNYGLKNTEVLQHSEKGILSFAKELQSFNK